MEDLKDDQKQEWRLHSIKGLFDLQRSLNSQEAQIRTLDLPANSWNIMIITFVNKVSIGLNPFLSIVVVIMHHLSLYVFARNGCSSLNKRVCLSFVIFFFPSSSVGKRCSLNSNVDAFQTTSIIKYSVRKI